MSLKLPSHVQPRYPQQALSVLRHPRCYSHFWRKLKSNLSGHVNKISTFTLLLNSDLVSASLDTTINIWDINQKFLKKKLIGHTDSVISLAVLKNGNLASGSDDFTIKIWSILDWSCVTLNGHSNKITSLITLNNGYPGLNLHGDQEKKKRESRF